MSSVRRDIPRINYNERQLARKAWNQVENNIDSPIRAPIMPVTGLGDNDQQGSTTHQDDLVSNYSVISNFDRNMDIKAAENKLNAKQILLNRYVEMAEQSYIAGLSENEFDRRVNSIQRNVYYLDDLLGFAIHYENEDLQERASDLIYKAQSAIDKMKEFRADLEKHDNVKTIEHISTVDTKDNRNMNKPDIDDRSELSFDHSINENGGLAKHSHIVDPNSTLNRNKDDINNRNDSSKQSSNSFVAFQSDEVTKANIMKAESLINSIALTTRTQIDVSLSEAKLQSISKTDIPYLERKIENINSFCVELSKDESRYANTISSLIHATMKASNWIHESLIVIKAKKLDITDDSTHNAEPIKLKPYDGWKSQDSIFDFINDFDKLYGNTRPSVKAAALYKNYLSESVANEVSHLYSTNDYEGIINHLLDKYGNARRIVNAKKATLQNLKYNPKDTEVQIIYLRSFYQVLLNLETLVSSYNCQLKDIGNEVYNQAFIQSLPQLMPEFHRRKVLKELSKAERKSYSQLSDKEEFDVIKDYLKVELVDLEYAVAKCPETPKEKEVKTNKIGVHNLDTTNVKKVGKYSNIKSKDKGAKKEYKVWLKCPMHNFLADSFSHPIGSCEEFCSATPSDRFERVNHYQLCCSCLSDWCGRNKEECVHLDKIPKNLLCQSCKDSNPARPNNVLVCKDHQTKYKDIVSSLSYFPGYTEGNNIQLNHVEILSMNKAFEVDTQKEVIYNVSDGTTSQNTSESEIEIKPENRNSSIYLYQMLKVAGMSCLTMYDSGSSGEAVQGDFAIKAGFTCVDNRNQQINVAGGGTINTGYGIYRCVLGPLEDGKYVRKILVGLKNITKPVPEYDLSVINNESRSVVAVAGEKLPIAIGGMATKLLIGIDSPELFPDKIFELPNGLAIFRGKLTDIYGSRVIYGGPHETFNKVDSTFAHLEFNTVTILFKELCNSYQNSLMSSMLAGSYCKDEQDLTCNTLIKYRNYDDINISDINASPIEDTPSESKFSAQVTICHKEHIEKEIEQAITESLICGCCGEPTERVSQPEVMIHRDSTGDPTAAATQVRYLYELSIHKMKVTAKQTQDLTDDEEMLIYSYRCAKCQDCSTCLSADKTKMLSIREEEEDKIIEKSIVWDKENKVMFCRYPWTQNPNSTFLKLWGKSSNIQQAFAILRQQMKKPKNWKEGALQFHKELIAKNYVCKVSDLNLEQQEIIRNAKVKHYLPWRVVAKPGSVSTPYRIVTDPSVTHMNTILAKGSNSLVNLYCMLVRFRMHKYAYSFDLSKMYNTLRLLDQMLPFSLYLMSQNLDEGAQVEDYVFLTLIYGLICAGNLAIFAVHILAENFKTSEPLAHKALTDELYMDDGFSGSKSVDKVHDILDSVKRVLPAGGFKIKCTTISGEDPSPEASSDGVSTGLAGYVWYPKSDELKIGMGDMNFNKKIRGYRKPNDKPIIEEEDLNHIIPEKITRRLALSKSAEFWDIIGLLEPAKVKFKLDLKELTCYDWDDFISSELTKIWKENFHLMARAQKVHIPRAVVPIDAVDPEKFEFLITCDASLLMCSAVCYVRFRKKNGTFSCDLLTAKSRSCSSTVPRNELCANVLAAEMFHTLHKSFKENIEDYYIVTDSVIALCWIANDQKLLKAYCFNRVRQCHRLANVSQWRYIPGVLNPADHATKGDVPDYLFSPDSSWFKGHNWMQNELSTSPLKDYDNICANLTQDQIDTIDDETVVTETEVQINHMANVVIPSPANLIDFIKVGFERAFYRLSLVVRFISKIKHRIHKKNNINLSSCKYCQIQKEMFDKPAFKAMESKLSDHSFPIDNTDNLITVSSTDRWITWNYLHKAMTFDVKLKLQENKLKSFHEEDGILYHGGRLSSLDHIETVDDLKDRITPFYEEIKYMNPVALITNPIVYSFMIYLHITSQHCGVERLVNNTFKVLYVEKCRTLARKIRQDCIMCKIKLLKSYKTKIADQNHFSYTIAPPFYASQIDIISKFKAHDIYVRTTKDCYVLILVCCLTQAVALYVLETYETASVVSALVRHSSRYAWPKFLLPDEGAQLLKLKDLKFNVRDLQQRLWLEQQVILDPCNPKSHWEHGRVESRIGCVRDTLKSMIEYKNSLLGWETIMASISSTLNSIPITRGNDNRGSVNYEFDLITPFSCILGHNSNRTHDGIVLLEKLPSRHLEKVRTTLQAYYSQLTNTFHRLIPAPSKWKSNDPVGLGDIVLFLDEEGMKYNGWKYGKVLETNVQGRHTKLKIGYRNASEKSDRTVFRHPRNCVPIWCEQDIDFNTTAHFRAMCAQQKYENPE